MNASRPEPSTEPVELVVAENQAGNRLDWYLARQFPSYSRTHLRRVINAACVKVNGKRTKASHHLSAGDTVSLVLPQMPRSGPEPEEIPLDILYEDDALAVINKPPGMVVHPAKGHWKGTLASASAISFRSTEQRGRADAAGDHSSPRPRHERRDRGRQT